MWVHVHENKGGWGWWGADVSSSIPQPLISLSLVNTHYDFSRVRITDLTFPSLKSAFACCYYMCVPDTSLKLDSTQGCHTPSISILSRSLALPLFAARCANLKSSLHREVRSWCHYQSIVHTQHSHPENILRSNTHNEGKKNPLLQCAAADSADPGG